ncbi:TatD family hydrolase [Chloroflexota bacterium]
MTKLIDTHAHLEEIENLEQALTAARMAGVTAIVAVGSDYASNQQVLQFARAYPSFVYPALGLHPSMIENTEIDRNLAFIEANIDRAVAVGEVGLDYHKRIRAKSGKDLQKYVLKEVLKIAGTHDKPVIIHSRYAWRDAFSLVSEAQVKKAVFHWYTGTSSVLRDIINHGYYLSATPAVEYHEEHRRAIEETPLDNLFLETDSPVVYGRGREFEYESRPADVLRTSTNVAKLKSMGETQIAERTTDNALRFFSL